MAFDSEPLRLTDPPRKGGAVRSLQTLLSKAGIVTTIDGVFGAGTEKAVKAFQSKHGLTVDGVVEDKTLTALRAAAKSAGSTSSESAAATSASVASAASKTATPKTSASKASTPKAEKTITKPAVFKQGEAGLEVLEIQRKLKAADLLDGEPDGDFGSKTKQALISFQKRLNLVPDGVAGPKVLEALGLQMKRMQREVATQLFSAGLVAKMFRDAPLKNIETYLPKVLASMQKVGLGDRDMILMALSTIRAESASFAPIDEYPSQYNTAPGGAPFALYDFRGDLGNGAAGDGDKYKGRGFIQLTGKVNYDEYGKRIGVGDRLLKSPELANDPVIAADVLAHFLKQKEGIIRVALHKGDFKKARRAVNGGEHGLDNFKAAMTTGAQLTTTA